MNKEACGKQKLKKLKINVNPFFSGSQRASFLVSGYGRSQMSKDAISVDSQDKLYIFQTHAGTRDKIMTETLRRRPEKQNKNQNQKQQKQRTTKTKK